MGFYALICLAPLALLLVWLLQIIMGPGRETYEWVRTSVERVAGEAAGGVMGEIDALLTNPDAHIAGIFSIGILIWAGIRLFEAVEMSLRDVWRGPEPRGVVKRKLIAFVSMLAGGFLFVIAMLLMAFLPALLDYLDRLPMVNAEEIALVRPGLRLAIEGLMAFTAFFLLFKFVPVQNVPGLSAAAGALFTAGAWMVVMPIFRMVMARSAEQSALYGGLAGVVLFLTWAFFGANLLLLGAQLTAAHEHVISRGRPERLDDDFIHTAGEFVMDSHAEDEQGEEPQAAADRPPPGPV